jgi:hypothetical protein
MARDDNFVPGRRSRRNPMARKLRANNHTSKRWLGLKVIVALMVGMTLAILATQYNTLQQRVRRVNGRLGEADGITDTFEPLPPRSEAAPAAEPEWEKAEVTITEPVVEVAAVEGQYTPTDGAYDCPPDFPIKGNSKSHIYHLPGGASYNATMPNICFATEAAAEAAGYRATKR